MTRQQQNLEILKELEKFFKKKKDLRFIQGLWALGLIGGEDRFYEESVATLDYLIKKCEDTKNIVEEDFKLDEGSRNKGCMYCKFYVEDYGCSNENNVIRSKFPYNYLDGKVLPVPAKDFNARLKCPYYKDFKGIRRDMISIYLVVFILLVVGCILGIAIAQSMPCTVG